MYSSILKRLFYIVSLFIFSSCIPLPQVPSFQYRGFPDKVKIGILQNVKKANIKVRGPFEMRVGTGRRVTVNQYNKGRIYIVKATHQGININGLISKDTIGLYPRSDKGKISVNKKRYRGAILIRFKNPGRINVINVLGIEYYLCGVMKPEISPSWPRDALKAQAVVSRTYTLRNLGKFSKEGFDLSSTPDCQVYAGIAGESQETNWAVRATRGEVVTYRGKLIKSFFHSNSGGFTEDVSQVWGMKGSPPSYLKGRASPYCKNSPHYQWKYQVSKTDIETALQKKGYKIRGIKKIRVSSYNRSGRAVMIHIYNQKSTIKMRANRFRIITGASKIRSTLFKIKDRGQDIEFSGRGWGHGVGMSQWGAKEMAKRGHNYKDIIKFYFPGTKVENWE